MFNNEQWILHTLYNARREDEETYRVYISLRRYIYDLREFSSVIENVSSTTVRFKPMNDLADDCLFSVSMFSRYIHDRSKRTGAPGVQFYSSIGQQAFKNIGYSNISKNWNFWVSYIQEHFCI